MDYRRKGQAMTETKTRIVLIERLSSAQADSIGLVLSSSGISYFVSREVPGWSILINSYDYEAALAAIQAYMAENRDDDNPAEPDESPPHIKTYSGLYVAVFLFLCHWLVVDGVGVSMAARNWGASAARILDGEWSRTVTALMLHADALHLGANMVGLALFGTAVCSIAGSGIGWLLILTSGMAGNYLNALLFGGGHLSIGASTAVFGALGIVASHQVVDKIRRPGQRLKAWIPLAGGLALLGILGSAANTDITAHLFGFMAGLVLGAAYALWTRTPPRKSTQMAGYIVTFCIIATCWLSAFDR
jgi:membrane associated rhomboid family serine protease